MRKVKFSIEIEVNMNDTTELLIKSTGITLANMIPSVLDHDTNSEVIGVSKVSGSVTLDVNCLEEVAI